MDAPSRFFFSLERKNGHGALTMEQLCGALQGMKQGKHQELIVRQLTFISLFGQGLEKAYWGY